MSYSSSVVDALSLGGLFLVSIAVVLLSIEAGWRLGDNRRRHAETESRAPIGAAVGATLGLLAFLLAFTFNMAASRYDTRKQIVTQEANAIGTTFLRADFLPPDSIAETRQLLQEYTIIRAGGQVSFMNPTGVLRSAAIQDRLWQIANDAQIQADTPATALYISSLNDVIDLDTERVTANRNRIPDTIWLILALVAVFSMAVMGYEFGLAGTRSWTVVILLVVIFTSVIVLIADLDRPQAGLIQVSQQPLLDLLNRIGGSMP